MPILGLRNKDGATKEIDVNGFVIAEATEQGLKMVKPLKILAPAEDDEPVQRGQTFGVGQTWQDVTATRTFEATNTNTTGKVIWVAARATTTAIQQSLGAAVGGVRVAFAQYAQASGVALGVNFLVPPGATYQVTSDAPNARAWWEYR